MSTERYTHTATINYGTAETLIQNVLKEGQRRGIHFSVAVTDASGHLCAFARADHTPFLTIDIAINKAWTAASFGVPTHSWNQLIQDPKLAPITETKRLVAVGGGSPLIIDGQLIGAIGISGGTYTEDQETAEHALAPLGFKLF